MTNKRIVWEQPDGTVAMFMPAPNAQSPDESIDDFVARVKARIEAANGVTAIVMLTRNLPHDGKHFRRAWKFSAPGVVETHMPTAREIHRDKIRAARAAELARLDAEYAKADEAGNQPLKAQIAQQRQVLRDLPQDPAIESAATPDDLKALWPTAQLGPSPSA